MLDQFVIPDRAVPYILFQRTAYLRLPVTFLYRYLFKFLPFPTPLYNLAVALEAGFQPERVKALYAKDMLQEYGTVKQLLPDRCPALLDIGCGVARIDVLLYRHYAQQSVELYLLDKSQVAQNVYYLFTHALPSTTPWTWPALLMANGVPAACIQLLEATDTRTILVPTSVHLVLSLLSWGFHYPVHIYLDQVYQLPSPDGIVILDVRKGTDGVPKLRQRFSDLLVILDTDKYQPVLVKQ